MATVSKKGGSTKKGTKKAKGTPSIRTFYDSVEDSSKSIEHENTEDEEDYRRKKNKSQDDFDSDFTALNNMVRESWDDEGRNGSWHRQVTRKEAEDEESEIEFRELNTTLIKTSREGEGKQDGEVKKKEVPNFDEMSFEELKNGPVRAEVV